MINYHSVKQAIISNEFVDKTNYFEEILDRRYMSFENCSETGSSTFIKCLAYFLDKSVNSKDIFKKMNVGNCDFFDQSVNTYCVLSLNFSDFEAKNFEEAIDYLKNKMSTIYKHFYHYFELESHIYFDFISLEHALDIIEKRTDKKDLQLSLSRLIFLLKDQKYKQNDFKFAIFIDNIIAMEMKAEKEGFDKEMKEFLKGFIVEDIYKHCDIFMQICDSKVEYDSWFITHHYISYHYWGVNTLDLKERFPHIIVDKNELVPFDNVYCMTDNKNWNTIIEKGRRKIEYAKAEEELRQQEIRRQEKLKYAKELSSLIPLFSNNLGIRRKHMDKTSHKYIELTNYLKGIYISKRSIFRKDEIYNQLVKLHESDTIIRDIRKYGEQLENLARGNSNWTYVNVNTSVGCWIQVTYCSARNKHSLSPNKAENLKIYACLNTSNIQGVFIDTLKYLLTHAEDTFAAKIAKFNRSDQMCYWISPSDFKHLERFYMQYSDNMVKSMPFVAYKGKLGITKEFPDADSSHNATIAHIITDYLKTIPNVEEVDLEDMYNNYIAKWNADIYDTNDYGSFKQSSALSFIVIMDTLDILLGISQLNESSFLLSDDNKFWQILAQSKCWAEVNDKYSQRINP